MDTTKYLPTHHDVSQGKLPASQQRLPTFLPSTTISPTLSPQTQSPRCQHNSNSSPTMASPASSSAPALSLCSHQPLSLPASACRSKPTLLHLALCNARVP